MKNAVSVYQPGIIATIECFTLREKELQQFVVYTYYSKDKEVLYVGQSKDFYNAHYSNSLRLECAQDIEYVGFVFFKNEDEIKDAVRYFIKARNPLYNKRKYDFLPVLPDVGVDNDDFVVNNHEMQKRWAEWLE